jgi:hypothetical protein
MRSMILHSRSSWCISEAGTLCKRFSTLKRRGDDDFRLCHGRRFEKGRKAFAVFKGYVKFGEVLEREEMNS